MDNIHQQLKSKIILFFFFLILFSIESIVADSVHKSTLNDAKFVQIYELAINVSDFSDL